MAKYRICPQPSSYINHSHEFSEKIGLMDLTGVECAVARYIGARADFETGINAYPSSQTIADAVHFSRSSVIRALRTLEDKGLIEAYRKIGSTNVYRTIIPHIPSDIMDQCRERKRRSLFHLPESVATTSVTVTLVSDDTEHTTCVTEDVTCVTEDVTCVTATPNLSLPINDPPQTNRSTGSRFARFRKNKGRSLRSLPQEEAPNEPTSHLTHDQPLTRAASECLATLDPQAPIEVVQEARERAADQIDVDRERSAHEPPPVRGLLGSASDSMIGQEQSHSDEREAPAMEDEAMSDEHSDDEPEQSDDEIKALMNRSWRDWLMTDEERARFGTNPALEAERAFMPTPAPQQATSDAEAMQQSTSDGPCEVCPSEDDILKLVHELERQILCTNIDPDGRCIITMLKPIITRACKRPGIDMIDVEIEATRIIQDATCANVRDESRRWGWMISALNGALRAMQPFATPRPTHPLPPPADEPQGRRFVDTEGYVWIDRTPRPEDELPWDHEGRKMMNPVLTYGEWQAYLDALPKPGTPEHDARVREMEEGIASIHAMLNGILSDPKQLAWRDANTNMELH